MRDAPGPAELAKAITVNACRNPPTSGVTVTVTLVSVVGAKAAHTSEVPKRALVRRTSDQVSPAPETVARLSDAAVGSVAADEGEEPAAGSGGAEGGGGLGAGTGTVDGDVHGRSCAARGVDGVGEAPVRCWW